LLREDERQPSHPPTRTEVEVLGSLPGHASRDGEHLGSASKAPEHSRSPTAPTRTPASRPLRPDRSWLVAEPAFYVVNVSLYEGR
jgi:hypothetical protein